MDFVNTYCGFRISIGPIKIERKRDELGRNFTL